MMQFPDEFVEIDYTNWRGERAIRKIVPKRIHFGSNEWHQNAQWLLTALDPNTKTEKTFAMSNIHSWKASSP